MSYPCFFFGSRPLRQRKKAAVQASKLPWPWLNTKSSEMLKWQFIVLSAKLSKMLRFCYCTVKLEDFLKQIEPKAKAKKKTHRSNVAFTYQRMGIRHGPRIVSVKCSPYDCCLEGSTTLRDGGENREVWYLGVISSLVLLQGKLILCMSDGS